ncbi:hypothetical protein EJK48_0985 [Moraxella catarrhalis]|uniref:Uncharacterized protein n=1 Tax=Moraxella catarrhalis TaxID=480 RepID=A0A3Q9GFK4_MORCA|nr:hypothetical protein EJK53_0981 [Moraxella catarrhalis]AZQ95238.1 hypothetical protein EJK48_0985 [Moraxella catarrhalis]RUO12129.1 hypothetical protein EJK49_0099 [Moraxella catarrhalis]
MPCLDDNDKTWGYICKSRYNADLCQRMTALKSINHLA